MQQGSGGSVLAGMPDSGTHPLLTRLLAKRNVEAERQDLTEAFLTQLGISDVSGAQVAQELRASAVETTPLSSQNRPAQGLNGRLGKTRGKSNGYSVARKLRKLLKDQSTSAA